MSGLICIQTVTNFDTLMVFLKYVFETVDFEIKKKQQTKEKCVQVPGRQRVNIIRHTPPETQSPTGLNLGWLSYTDKDY